MLERSFTPRLKGGILSAFMFAESDGDNYGKLVLYAGAEHAAPSPGQAATLIQSDQFISSQFTLLGSSGSRVIQGDVQLITDRQRDHVRPPGLDPRRGQLRPSRAINRVAAAVGQQAVLGCDMTDAVSALVTGNADPPADVAAA